jgi:hypothetical protein
VTRWLGLGIVVVVGCAPKVPAPVGSSTPAGSAPIELSVSEPIDFGKCETRTLTIEGPNRQAFASTGDVQALSKGLDVTVVRASRSSVDLLVTIDPIQNDSALLATTEVSTLFTAGGSTFKLRVPLRPSFKLATNSVYLEGDRTEEVALEVPPGMEPPQIVDQSSGVIARMEGSTLTVRRGASPYPLGFVVLRSSETGYSQALLVHDAALKRMGWGSSSLPDPWPKASLEVTLTVRRKGPIPPTDLILDPPGRYRVASVKGKGRTRTVTLESLQARAGYVVISDKSRTGQVDPILIEPLKL